MIFEIVLARNCGYPFKAKFSLGDDMTVTVNMRELLDAGVHYGHQCRRWNPKMKPYIFGKRNGIHIVDLQKTVRQFQKATEFLERTAARGRHVLFVGTKRQAREVIAEEAGRSGMYFVNQRWLGGTLTNYSTIRQSIHQLKHIERMATDGTFQKLPKKEVLNLQREKEKLERNLGGIKDMPGLPAAIFVVDAQKEATAIKEARRIGIPVVAVTDTNSDPDGIDYVIPGNDDSLKAIQIFVRTAAEACISGKMMAKDLPKEERDRTSVEEGSFFDESGHSVSVQRAPSYDAPEAKTEGR